MEQSNGSNKVEVKRTRQAKGFALARMRGIMFFSLAKNFLVHKAGKKECSTRGCYNFLRQARHLVDAYWESNGRIRTTWILWLPALSFELANSGASICVIKDSKVPAAGVMEANDGTDGMTKWKKIELLLGAAPFHSNITAISSPLLSLSLKPKFFLKKFCLETPS